MQEEGHEDFSSNLGKRIFCLLAVQLCYIILLSLLYLQIAINVSSFNVPSLIQSRQCPLESESGTPCFFCHQLPEINSLASFVILHLYF